MLFAFRTDASIQMGTGHVMRCLTLADALRKEGAEIIFICREHIGHLADTIISKGYFVKLLPLTSVECSKKDSALAHAGWLGVNQAQDADQCKTVLGDINLDWLIVDHYAIDESWEFALRSHCKRIMVIDDLADRKHDCEILLDQTYGRSKDDYQNLVSENCELLLGSGFSILRPEFSRWREYSLKRRVDPELKSFLISMGGVDPDNYTGQLLELFRDSELREGVKITVVMGKTAPHIENIWQIAKEMDYPVKVLVDVSNMAELMANADLAIGAVGATTWERSCLGVPSILLAIANNQIYAAKKLVHDGVIELCKDLVCVVDFVISLEKDRLISLTKTSAKLTDGSGCHKVINKMLEISA